MNPLKKQNSFEQKLQENLDGMEFKPSDALWDKIAQNISTDTFEPKLQQKLHNFSVEPKSETWDQLSAQLPEKKRRFGWLWLSSALVLVSLAGTIGYFQFNPSEENLAWVQAKNTTKIESQSVKAAKPSVQASIKLKTTKTAASKKQVLSGLNQTNFEENKANTQSFIQQKKKARLEPTLALSAEESQSNSSTNKIVSTQLPPNQVASTQTNAGPSQEAPKQASPIADLQNKVKEIAADKPISDNKILLDSQLVSPAVKTNAYMESDLELSKLSIVASIGAHMSFMQLIAPANNSAQLSKALALRKEIENPEIDYNANLSGEYAITEKLFIRAGIGILSFTQDVRYNLTNADSVPQRGYAANFYMHNSDSIVVGSSYTTKNKYSFTEIPVSIGYKIFRGEHVGFDLNLGLSYGKLNLVNAYLPDQSCIGLMVISDKASFPTYKNMWFVNFSPAIVWQMGSTLDVGAMPQLRVGINNLVEAENWIGQRPWSTGLNLFLRKRF